MKKIFKIVLSIIIVFILIAGGGMFYLSRGLESGKNLKINPVKLSAVKDGTYDGKYKAGRWTNEVSVTVGNHRITGIEIVKDVKFPKPEWTKELLSRVLNKQSVNVDVVSGATITSKAYLKSIEIALSK